jgi:hypothetical protein
LAVTTTDPAPVIVIVAPLTIAGPVTLKVTGSPELALADNASGLAPKVRAEDGDAKLIVCAACVTVTLTAVAVAEPHVLLPP